jgi:porin
MPKLQITTPGGWLRPARAGLDALARQAGGNGRIGTTTPGQAVAAPGLLEPAGHERLARGEGVGTRRRQAGAAHRKGRKPEYSEEPRHDFHAAILGACADAAPRSCHKRMGWILGAVFAAMLHAGGARADEPAGAADPAEATEPDVTLAAVYTGESLHNVAGGIARGSAYVDNLDLQAKFGGRKWGMPGVTAFLYVLYNNGAEFAGPYTGSLQGISNIEAVPSTRLYEAWLEVPAPGGGTLRGGLYNFNTEFDSNEVGALFIAPEHGIGTELAHTGITGPSIFPVSGLALRYQREAGPWRMQAAVLDAVPGDPDDPRRTYVSLGDGALLVGEIGHTSDALKITLGAWHYTIRMPDLLATGPDGEPLQHKGNSGAYVLASHSFWSDAESGRGLAAFARYGMSDARVYQTGDYLGLGIVATGALPGRPHDNLGLSLGAAANGSQYRSAAALSGTPVDRSELQFELAYRALLGERAYLQPELQYIVNPGTDPTLADCWVVGLRFQYAFWQLP